MPTQNDPTSFWLTPLAIEGGVAVEFRGDHIHVQLGKGFEVSTQQRTTLWEMIGRMSAEYQTRRVLVEGKAPEGVFQTSEVIDAGQKTATVPKLWMAMSFDDFQPSELTELFETVAASRGIRVKHFTNAERALLWLRNNSPE